jgi:hypothetical protein
MDMQDNQESSAFNPAAGGEALGGGASAALSYEGRHRSIADEYDTPVVERMTDAQKRQLNEQLGVPLSPSTRSSREPLFSGNKPNLTPLLDEHGLPPEQQHHGIY